MRFICKTFNLGVCLATSSPFLSSTRPSIIMSSITPHQQAGQWSSQPSVAAPGTSTPSSGDSRTEQGTLEPHHGRDADADGFTKEEKDIGGAPQDPHAAEKTAAVRQKVEDFENQGFVLVGFEDGDMENPRNWSKAKRFFLVSFCSYLNVLVASQASAYSTGQTGVEETFGVSGEVATLGLSLYVLGKFPCAATRALLLFFRVLTGCHATSARVAM